MKTIFDKIRSRSERGQAIILIAFSMVGLVAAVGLMIDGGIALVEYARLKRGIDAASIAAASQFRKNFTGEELEKAGREFLRFNQSDAAVTIFTCSCPPDEPNCLANGWHLDDSLCAPPRQPQRKLVRVTASKKVTFGFMRVVGIKETTISATAIGEAASIDMVLAIDTSSSMAYETTPGGDPDRSDRAVPGVHPGDDPIACNNDPNRRCEPMGTIKDIAIDFVEELFYPYDRVSVVAFTGQTTDGTATREPFLVLPFEDNQDCDANGLNCVANTDIEDAIRSLRVYQPPVCPLPMAAHTDFLGPCLYFEPHYIGQTCIPYQVGVDDGSGNIVFDPTSCGASNIGGGLFLAGDQFADARQDSFWAVIALIGGPANAAVLPTAPSPHVGFCPPATWDLPGGSGFCRDLDHPTATRHTRNVDGTYPANYDADDYARDGADYITSPTTGQGATLYSICLGRYCSAYPNSFDPASAEHLGQYMALEAGGVNANHGLYFQSNNASDLAQVFASIADNIFTRISQ